MPISDFAAGKAADEARAGGAAATVTGRGAEA
jgi:hypothetical protein